MTPNDHVRFRYLHMNPKTLDADGIVNGRQVSEGEILGKVADWGDTENGTSYHIHFNIQVFTTVGWVWVNPYMTLVAAYERLIGGRGTEIMPGEPAPPVPEKPPVILHPTPPPEATSSAATPTPPAKAAEPAEEKPTRKRVRHRRRKPKNRRRIAAYAVDCPRGSSDYNAPCRESPAIRPPRPQHG